jgi:hypothetical protein
LVLDRWPAGPPWGGLRSAWHSKKLKPKNPHPYGNIMWTFLESAGETCVIFFNRRILLAFLVPSRCRFPECIRSTFPVDVILNRLAAPRCVFNLSFLTFFATYVTSLNFVPLADG